MQRQYKKALRIQRQEIERLEARLEARLSTGQAQQPTGNVVSLQIHLEARRVALDAIDALECKHLARMKALEDRQGCRDSLAQRQEVEQRLQVALTELVEARTGLGRCRSDLSRFIDQVLQENESLANLLSTHAPSVMTEYDALKRSRMWPDQAYRIKLCPVLRYTLLNSNQSLSNSFH